MTDVREQIAVIEALRAQAIATGDVATLRQMTDDEYAHVDGHGRLRNKQEFLGSLAAGGLRFTRYSVDDNVIAVHGDVAIVTGRFRNEQVTPEGATIAKHGRHVRVYIRTPTGWSNVVHQGTEIKAG